MLNPDIPADQIERIRTILDPLLARLQAQYSTLDPGADSALIYSLSADARQPEDGE